MLFTVILQFNSLPSTLPYPAHMVLILFVQVLKKVLKSLKFELKNPAATLIYNLKLSLGGISSLYDISIYFFISDIVWSNTVVWFERI